MRRGGSLIDPSFSTPKQDGSRGPTLRRAVGQVASVQAAVTRELTMLSEEMRREDRRTLWLANRARIC